MSVKLSSELLSTQTTPGWHWLRWQQHQTKLCERGLWLVESEAKFGILSSDWPTQNWHGLLLVYTLITYVQIDHSGLRGRHREEEWAPRKQICNVTLEYTCVPRSQRGRSTQIIQFHCLPNIHIHNHLFWTRSKKFSDYLVWLISSLDVRPIMIEIFP